MAKYRKEYVQRTLNFLDSTKIKLYSGLFHHLKIKLFELNSVKKGEKTCSRMQPGQMAHD